jgi:hypothetical protein
MASSALNKCVILEMKLSVPAPLSEYNPIQHNRPGLSPAEVYILSLFQFAINDSDFPALLYPLSKRVPKGSKAWMSEE